MTDKPQPDKFDWATELSDAQGHVTLSAQEAKEIGARLRSMRAKLKTHEDLGDAGSDVQLLRMGYTAARLEIESLRKEHADELAVAYMCGASREKELAAPQPVEREPLTREQVKAICVESGYETATLQERADFINGIRHAERHHGIKGGQHGADN